MLAIDFESGVTGTLATVRATPFYWRVHVFGTRGSAEVLDEATMVLRKSGTAPHQIKYPAVDSLAAELDAFADAIEGKHPFPVPEADVLATLSAFEAALRSMQSGQPVSLRCRLNRANANPRAIATLPPGCRRRSGSAAPMSAACCRPKPN